MWTDINIIILGLASVAGAWNFHRLQQRVANLEKLVSILALAETDRRTQQLTRHTERSCVP